MVAAYRVSCEDHDDFGDVPDFDAAVDWTNAHRINYPDHRVSAEPHGLPVAFPIDDAGIRAGEF